MAACFAMIAYQVGAKAVRDAFFLSQFEVTSLPRMVIVGALVSIAAVLGAARVMSRFTPARVVPAAFAASATMHVGIWFFSTSHPRESAVIVYLLSIAVGSILTSGFWSMLNERFDTYTAKGVVGRVAGAGTLGGMISGVVAERVAASASLSTMLPVLAFYQFVCAVVLLGMHTPATAPAPPRDQPEASGLEVLRQTPYLKTLAALVIVGTSSAAMIDYVFKSAALAEYGKGEQLLRFFAIFYSATGILTFLMQTTLTKFLLTHLGTARTVATLPFAVTVGGVLALFATGLWTTTIARGLETVFRGSLFRSSYEIFYMPMPVHEKRAAKGVIDVAFDRLGDAVGSAFVSLVIALGIVAVSPVVLTAAVLVALGGLYIASRLEGAYIDVLEHGMRDRASEVVAAAAAHESLGLSMFGGSMTVGLSMVSRQQPNDALTLTTLPGSHSMTQISAPAGSSTGHSTVMLADPIMKKIATLRHGDKSEIRQTVKEAGTHPELVPHLILLLGRDDVSQPVIHALQPLAERHAGQMLDALLSESTDFAIRRRIPRILRNTPRQMVADGLLLGLNDRRFEVRFQCGRTLAALAERNKMLRFAQTEIFGYIQKEVAVSKPVWESHRLLDQQEDPETSPIFDEVLRNRTSRGLQHIFALLSLVMPAEPLKLAFQGLHVDDPHLRGTALEYLSSVLPREIRDRLWPLIDDKDQREPPDSRSREQVLSELMRADQTIYLRIEELRKRAQN
jgi:ATP/ADP translocase